MPNPLKGIAMVLCAMAILPLIDVCAKFLGQQGIPVLEMVWARFFFGSLLTLPFALKAVGPAALTPINPALNSLRAFCLFAGTCFFFQALKTMAVADTLAIYFVQPILITALSPLILREHVDVKRWACVFLGFIGVLIIIRPGFQVVDTGVFFALLAGTSSAVYILVTRLLTGKADAMVTTFQSSVIGALPLTLAIPLYWVAPTSDQWLLLGLLGIIAIIGHYLITRAYDYAEASLLSPFNYTEMVSAVIVGWYFFGDFPDRWTFVGVAILIASAVYMSWQQRSEAKS
jgi:drug/metabolite transporter (DMT)-like permease